MYAFCCCWSYCTDAIAATVVNNVAKAASASVILSAVSSIQNWHRSAADMSALEGNTGAISGAKDGEYEVISNSLSKLHDALSRNTAPLSVYTIDDVPMYVPNALSDEYFVVL